MIEYNVITSWEVIMQRPAFTEGEFSWPDVQCEAIRIEDKFRMKSETGYKRVIVKIGSSSLTHEETGKLDLGKMEQLVRQLSDLRNRGMDVCLVSSGAIAVGRSAMGIHERPTDISMKQACAAVGQARLMMTYQKNTFEELFQLGVIPIVNENDTTSTYEMQFGDNDTLSALVSSMVGADLLILLSDIDGLYTDDPHTNPDAKLVQVVENLDEEILGMAKGTTGSNVGTGGMTTKLTAAKIATLSGTDMIIANGADVKILAQIFEDAYTGTLFKSNKNANFNLATYVMETIG